MSAATFLDVDDTCVTPESTSTGCTCAAVSAPTCATDRLLSVAVETAPICAAESVATPQIRNFGTLAGNVCQRPWCWYFRNGFPCFKAGGDQCFSVTGENQFHAIFGGGPSFIVHPSDTAVALMALDANFRIVGPSGERVVPASSFFPS